MGESASIGIKTLRDQRIKQYFVYTDGKLTSVYEAPTDAINGAKCILTTYTYSGSNVIKRKESDSTWSSAYDI